jgi:methyl-accepting chemotaxis protein
MFPLFATDAKATLDSLSRSLAIIEFDVSGNVMTANENFCKVLGYALEDIKGKHHSHFVDPIYRASGAYQDF